MAHRGRLPPRYAEPLRRRFDELAGERLVSGAVVLDVGSGRDPTYPAHQRPRGVTYVGLDVSARELELAPPGAYDDAVIADIALRREDLVGRFDLVVGWQVLEHVRTLAPAIENLRRYLRPGGGLVTFLSGRFAAFALANAVLPDRAGQALAHHLLRIPATDVFPAHYDRCYASALERLFAPWSHFSLDPVYRGAVYFRFSDPLLRAYLRYESWAQRARHSNLATHYLVGASP
jgi:SAM-dependent methyltransferase